VTPTCRRSMIRSPAVIEAAAPAHINTCFARIFCNRFGHALGARDERTQIRNSTAAEHW
jgi:hypothetical protein